MLFDGESDLRAALTQAVAAAPGGLQPLDLLLHAFRKVEHILEGNRPFAEPRLRVIAETPALRERDLAKAAAMAEAVAEALRRRGVADRPAVLAAQTGWAAFHHAIQSWIDDSAQSLDAHLLQTFDDLRATLSPTVPVGDAGRIMPPGACRRRPAVIRRRAEEPQKEPNVHYP
ncbi:hypothetical protein AB0C27_46040, partial [Nonomuraea sp. NPDC048882]|uniref:acyl-CoA-like ligand-binding transcription factor n=1 Tax=Nonomuraea sp. NPDC048882 TaxID=3154347 RepID=UPI0033F91121